MPDKNGSNRYGWNQRGPTVADQLETAMIQSEMSNPDSAYWKQRVAYSRNLLERYMGDREFKEWAERRFPGDSIDSFTWEEIHEAYSEKFQRVLAELAMVYTHCWENDPKHYKTNGG